jgi:site-specific DNA-methyltransferase (adenine-specific)
MAKFEGKFESAKQDWETPLSLFNVINDEFNFTLDAAASSENKKAEKFFCEADDGIIQDWGANTVWLNPPYGAGKSPISAWVKKAYEASLTGATTVMLIPARTNTNWFHDYCLEKGEVRFIKGRPKFGGAEHGLPQPLCYVIFRPVQ